jgi:flagellar hook-basal body complex protein FliE
MPIDAAFATTGPEWNISLGNATDPSIENDAAVGGAGSDFGGVLTQQLQNLADLQTQAADASTALATGTATDPAETVMAVERARLSMQLASTLRTKGVEAINDIFHTQV